jgi:hypothetical protein
MANVRVLNKDKYKLSKYRFRELYYFCLQYYEWKDQLIDKRNPLKGMQYSGMPSSGIPGNPTEAAAIACAEISAKCDMIEQAAKEADPELWEYIIYAVTHEDITFNFLKAKKDIPCERDRYYNSRRKFYFILDCKMRRRIEHEDKECKAGRCVEN